jgi:uncharacterized protein YndB with AHSA1/START domain
MPSTIEREIFIEAPVEVVWRAVTEPEQIVQWFSDEADVELKDGYEGSLTFTNRATTSPMVAHITVKAFEPDRSFTYWWSYEKGVAAAEGTAMLVEFTVAAESGGTRLRVVETGLEQLDWPQQQKDDYVADHNNGWAKHIGELGEYLAPKAPKQPV